jgi:hypothetical protein
LLDNITWKVEYHDGTNLVGISPKSYARIEREKLRSFDLIDPQGILFSTSPPEGADGRNLVYRRRTTISDIGTKVIFIIGWIPFGPAFAISLENGVRVLNDGFNENDAELYPPVLIAGEYRTE